MSNIIHITVHTPTNHFDINYVDEITLNRIKGICEEMNKGLDANTVRWTVETKEVVSTANYPTDDYEAFLTAISRSD